MGYDGSPEAAGNVGLVVVLRDERYGGGEFHTAPEWVHLRGLVLEPVGQGEHRHEVG